MVGYGLVALEVLLRLAIAAVLVRKYLRTRDIGLMWLGVAVVLWPPLSVLLQLGLVRAIGGGDIIMYLNQSQRVIGAGLLLVAVLYLSRKKDIGNLRPKQ
jgi:hypothetical protein